MNKIMIEKTILDHKLVVIIRAEKITNIGSIIEALLRGGVKILEVSFNTPGATGFIRSIVDEFGNDVCCGAGTVLDEFMAMSAIEAGSQFVISPVFLPGMIKTCLTQGVPPIPGIFTPSEALNAYKLGASFLKVFPAGIHGPGFIKAVKRVLPQLLLIPVGGINLDNVEDFIRSGASAVAVGSAIINDELLREGNYKQIEQNARLYSERITACSM